MRRMIAIGWLVAGLGFSANAALVHRYDFATDGAVIDTVGTANGTLAGSAMVIGGALVTDGSAGQFNDGVAQNSATLDASAVSGITGAFSIETWVNCTAGGVWKTAFSFSDGSRGNYVIATPARDRPGFPSGVAFLGGGSADGEETVNGKTLTEQPLGAVHQMLLTYDGTDFNYYVDGALATKVPTITKPGLNLSVLDQIGVGGGSPWPDNTIGGSTMDFRIYNEALTALKVANIYGLGADASNESIAAIVSDVSAKNEEILLPKTACKGWGALLSSSLLTVRKDD